MRVANRIASAMLGLILLALGLFAIVQTISTLVGRPWPITESWRRSLGTVPFSDWRVLLTSIIVAVVGLIALVAQLVPHRQQRLPAEIDGNIWWMSRRSVERRSERAAASIGGAHHPRASVRGDPRRWRVQISGDASAHRYEAVERSVRDELRTIGAPDDVDLTVSLRQKGRVA